MENKGRYQVVPPLTQEEYAALKSSILTDGVRVAVVKDAEGHTIDGYHREQAWRELREEGHDVPDYLVEVRADLEAEADKRDLAWSLNMQRRHLSSEDKRRLVEAKLIESPHWSNSRLARLLGVSDHTVSSARRQLESTSQIARLDRLEGSDGKQHPRSRERDLEKESEETERRTVRVEHLSKGGHTDDEPSAQRFDVIHVIPEVVATERYDLEVSNRSRDRDSGSLTTARGDRYRMAEQLNPRTNKQAAVQVLIAMERAVVELRRAIQGRQRDAALSPEELVEELDADRGRESLPHFSGNANQIRSVGAWLVELADQMEANSS